MVLKSVLEIALESGNPQQLFYDINLISTHSLGYRPIKHCSCKGNSRSDHGEAYRECVDCFHYGDKPKFWQRQKNKGGEGVVFVVESFTSVPSYAKNDGPKCSIKESARLLLKSSLKKDEKIGKMRCYGYGPGFKGKKEADFRCPKGSWYERLGAPDAINAITIRKIMRKILGPLY